MKNKADLTERLATAERTVRFLTARNFDSNGMEAAELKAAEQELAALEAERRALINSPEFLSRD